MTDHHNTGKRHAAKPDSERADSYLQIRVRQADKARWVKQAQREDMKLSEWVIDRLNDTGNA